MKKLLFITNAYPYYPGEQFIEDEIIFWDRQNDFDVTVLPLTAKGNPRKLPNSIHLDHSLVDNGSKNLIYLLIVPFKLVFFREMLYLIKNNKLSFNTFKSLVAGTVKFLKHKNSLEKYVKRDVNVDIVYSYWNNYASYASIKLSNKKNITKAVSRAHRVDLYEETNKSNYLPLKRQFVNDFDKIFCLSESATIYMNERFNAVKSSLSVARLGVEVPVNGNINITSDHFHIVSCSYCSSVKRIDKIIETIKNFGINQCETKIKWTHIGGGELLDNFEEMANNQLNNIENVTFSFKGSLINSEVKAFYKDNDVVVFINMSESEGIPVSIMEAMANGIPAIAPDVGGIKDLVNQENGYLLGRDADINDAVKALSKMLSLSERDVYNTRKKAKEMVSSLYNKNINYVDFINELKEICSN